MERWYQPDRDHPTVGVRLLREAYQLQTERSTSCLTFAARLGEMQDRERAEEKAREADNSRASQKPPGQTDEQHAAYREVLAKHSAMVLSELKQQDTILASAYGELFEWRFRELHQIQDAKLMLSEIALHPLTGFSPVDLVIPGR